MNKYSRYFNNIAHIYCSCSIVVEESHTAAAIYPPDYSFDSCNSQESERYDFECKRGDLRSCLIISYAQKSIKDTNRLKDINYVRK